MTRVICKSGTPEAGTTRVTWERDKALIVFRRVPAKICPNCGESYLDDGVVADVYHAACQVAKAGVGGHNLIGTPIARQVNCFMQRMADIRRRERLNTRVLAMVIMGACDLC